MPTYLFQSSALVVDEQSDVLTGSLVGNLSRSVKKFESQLSKFQADVLKRLEKIEATVAQLEKMSRTLIQPNLAAARPRRPRGWSNSMARRHVDSQRWSKASSGVWSEYEDIDFSTDPNMRSRTGSLAQPLGNQQVIYETHRDTT